MRTIYLAAVHVLAAVGMLALAFVVLVAPGFDSTREERLLAEISRVHEENAKLKEHRAKPTLDAMAQEP